MARLLKRDLFVQTSNHTFELSFKSGVTVIRNENTKISNDLLFELLMSYYDYYKIGKAVFFDGKELSNSRHQVYNYLDVSDKLIFINNADLLLVDRIERHIFNDFYNQYILFGNRPDMYRARAEHIASLNEIQLNNFVLNYTE